MTLQSSGFLSSVPETRIPSLKRKRPGRTQTPRCEKAGVPGIWPLSMNQEASGPRCSPGPPGRWPGGVSECLLGRLFPFSLTDVLLSGSYPVPEPPGAGGPGELLGTPQKPNHVNTKWSAGWFRATQQPGPRQWRKPRTCPRKQLVFTVFHRSRGAQALLSSGSGPWAPQIGNNGAAPGTRRHPVSLTFAVPLVPPSQQVGQFRCK